MEASAQALIHEWKHLTSLSASVWIPDAKMELITPSGRQVDLQTSPTICIG